MAAYPWRFQADLNIDQPDPYVTVFIGDMHTNDTTGEQIIQQNTANPVTVLLSELPAFLADAIASGVTRKKDPGAMP